MMTIAEAISDLLFVRETVVVPGLGAFVKKPVPAIVDLEANCFAPPSSKVEFDASLREENDLVVRYLSENNGIEVGEVAQMLASFVADCFNDLKSGKKCVLAGVGTLAYDSNGEITFEEDGTVNYNGDAFGLTGFTMPAVLPDKNEPVSVDEEPVHEDEPGSGKKHKAWYWALLAACVLIGGIFGLRHFITSPQEPKEPSDKGEQTVAQTVINDSIDEEQPDADSSLVALPSLTRIVAATEYRVVAGCYDREENALWFANVLRSVGFTEAFYEKRGERWFVSFAHYATYDEALDALMDIRNDTVYQAWILVPQEH